MSSPDTADTASHPAMRLKLQAKDPRTVRELRARGLECQSGLQIGSRLTAETPIRLSSAVLIGSCELGAFTYVGSGSELRNARIGRFCSIAANVALGPAEHPLDWVSSHPVGFDGVRYFDEYPDWSAFTSTEVRFRGNSRTTHIGHDVWIGRNAIVRQGVTVGDGAVIAGGAFVNRDVAPYTIVAGTPARVVRTRFDTPLIEQLSALQWWQWRLDRQRTGLDFSNVTDFVTQLAQLLERGQLQAFTPPRHALHRQNDELVIESLPSLPHSLATPS